MAFERIEEKKEEASSQSCDSCIYHTCEHSCNFTEWTWRSQRLNALLTHNKVTVKSFSMRLSFLFISHNNIWIWLFCSILVVQSGPLHQKNMFYVYICSKLNLAVWLRSGSCESNSILPLMVETRPCVNLDEQMRTCHVCCLVDVEHEFFLMRNYTNFCLTA